MTSLFWSSDHIAWPFFTIIVFSVLCLLATDIAWRVISARSRTLFSVATLVWAAGVAALTLFWHA